MSDSLSRKIAPNVYWSNESEWWPTVGNRGTVTVDTLYHIKHFLKEHEGIEFTQWDITCALNINHNSVGVALKYLLDEGCILAEPRDRGPRYTWKTTNLTTKKRSRTKNVGNPA